MIEVTQIIKADGESLDIDIDQSGSLDDNRTYAINLTAVLTNNQGRIDIDGQLSGDVITPCDRCLGNFDFPIDIAIHESVTSDLPEENYINGYLFDSERFIFEQLSLVMPIAAVCKKCREED